MAPRSRVKHSTTEPLGSHREILIKYNVYLKKLYYTCENISCISQVKLEALCFLRLLPLAHFRFSNPYNLLISEQNHKVWVLIFLIRSQGKFWLLNCRDLLKFSLWF